MQRFNTSSNTWMTAGPRMNLGRGTPGCCYDPSNDNIFIFGGLHGYSSMVDSYYDSIEKYNNNQWTIISTATLSVPKHEVRCRLLAIDANIYCIGGVVHPFAPNNVVDVFDPRTETMVDRLFLNEARHAFVATLWNSDRCIIVSGGNYADNYTTLLGSIETFG